MKSLTKEKAHEILNKYIKTQFILDHSLESAFIMKALAKYFTEDENLWYNIGLLHDLDMDTINGDYSHHGEVTKEILKNEGIEDESLVNPILAHTECLECMGGKYKRQEKVDFCLAASEQITGILTSYARMRPTRFEEMEVKSVKKKLKDKAFAANVNREFIYDIEETEISLDEFLQIAIEAIYEIRNEINI